MMLNKFIACLLAMVFVAGCMPVARAEESAIAQLRERYGGPIPEDVLAWMKESYTPETVDFGAVSLTFSEVLCDGRWLYTAVRAVPNDPDAVLIFPASAMMDDRVSGGYGEQLRGDDRTFQDAAIEDGKRLVMVYVYPALLDDLPEYFIDHFQVADDVSILLSGGMVSLEGEKVETDWSVYIAEIDPQTGEKIDKTEVEALHKLEAPILTPMERREYKAGDIADGKLPFETMTLIRTPLTVYSEVGWMHEDDAFEYSYTLLDAGGVEYPEGASAEVDVFAMEKLPDALLMELQNHDDETGQTEVIRLEAAE